MTTLASPCLPRIRVPPPGPESRRLAERLRRVESRNVTQVDEHGPIFWAEARGANVRDVDGNVYIDLTAGFGVAAAGHSAPDVVAALCAQAERLPHALGDVHPAEPKVGLLERLAEIAPGRLSVGVLAGGGAEAVEVALKSAALRTGRPGVIAFRGAYHGLTYGALAVTAREEFRAPFERQLYRGVRFAPYPRSADETQSALDAVRRLAAESDAVGAVVVEPVQGRGGVVVPPDGFLPGLRAACDELGLLLIFDEVYTGLGRTGRWFACEHWNVEPDLLVLGKALTGVLPLAATLGTPDVMVGWPESAGEALHTSTFMGNPIACAAALAQLDRIRQDGLVERAARLGARLRDRLDAWVRGRRGVGSARGLGLMQAIVLVGRDGAPAAGAAVAVARRALRQGVIILPEGADGSVLAFTPPLSIEERLLDAALDVVADALNAAAG